MLGNRCVPRAKQALPPREGTMLEHMRRSGLALTRRQFLGTGLAALTSAGCGSGPDVFTGPVGEDTARLQARPTRPTRAVQPGQHSLELGSGRNGAFYVPAAYRPETPAPLLVMLHGAGGGADNMAALAALAEEVGAILLVPESRGRTWDVIRAVPAPDVASLDRALTYVFERCAVDPARLGIGGFSDGASYGLSLGLTNGDLFPISWRSRPASLRHHAASASRASSSPTAPRTVFCRSSSAGASYGSWSPPTTTCYSASSMAATLCPAPWCGKRSPASRADEAQDGGAHSVSRCTA